MQIFLRYIEPFHSVIRFGLATTDKEFNFWYLHTFSGLTTEKVFDGNNEEGSFPQSYGSINNGSVGT